jgi:hypothetical protein
MFVLGKVITFEPTLRFGTILPFRKRQSVPVMIGYYATADRHRGGGDGVVKNGQIFFFFFFLSANLLDKI